MGRFFEHRDTNIPSLHVPYPLEFLQNKISGLENQYEQVKESAALEGSKMVSIEAMPYSQKAIAFRDNLNKQVMDEVNDISEKLLPQNLDKSNPMSTVYEMARRIHEVKSIKNRVNVPGTDEYDINEAAKEWKEFEKKVYESDEPEDEKLGKLKRAIVDYAGYDGLKNYKDERTGANRRIIPYNKSQKYNIKDALVKHLEGVEITKIGSENEFEDGMWLRTIGGSSEKRKQGKLFNAGHSFLMSGEEKSRIVNRLENLSYSKYFGENEDGTANNEEKQEELRQQWLNKELFALQTGGVMFEYLKKEGDNYYINVDDNIESLLYILDRSTEVGNMMYDAIKSKTVDNKTSKNTITGNPNFNFAEQHRYTGPTPVTTSIGPTKIPGSIIPDNVTDSYIELTSKETQEWMNNAKEKGLGNLSPEDKDKYNSIIKKRNEANQNINMITSYAQEGFKKLNEIKGYDKLTPEQQNFFTYLQNNPELEYVFLNTNEEFNNTDSWFVREISKQTDAGEYLKDAGITFLKDVKSLITTGKITDDKTVYKSNEEGVNLKNFALNYANDRKDAYNNAINESNVNLTAFTYTKGSLEERQRATNNLLKYSGTSKIMNGDEVSENYKYVEGDEAVNTPFTINGKFYSVVSREIKDKKGKKTGRENIVIQDDGALAHAAEENAALGIEIATNRAKDIGSWSGEAKDSYYMHMTTILNTRMNNAPNILNNIQMFSSDFFPEHFKQTITINENGKGVNYDIVPYTEDSRYLKIVGVGSESGKIDRKAIYEGVIDALYEKPKLK